MRYTLIIGIANFGFIRIWRKAERGHYETAIRRQGESAGQWVNSIDHRRYTYIGISWECVVCACLSMLKLLPIYRITFIRVMYHFSVSRFSFSLPPYHTHREFPMSLLASQTLFLAQFPVRCFRYIHIEFYTRVQLISDYKYLFVRCEFNINWTDNMLQKATEKT